MTTNRLTSMAAIQATSAASPMNAPSPKEDLDRTLRRRAELLGLTPKGQAMALLQARIEILTDEAIATSAIEGVKVDRAEVRRAVIRHLAVQEGLL